MEESSGMKHNGSSNGGDEWHSWDAFCLDTQQRQPFFTRGPEGHEKERRGRRSFGTGNFYSASVAFLIDWGVVF
jgi:hypothetical protein